MEAAAAILSGSPVLMSCPSTRAVLSCTYSLIHFCVGATTLALVLSTAEELVGLQQNAQGRRVVPKIFPSQFSHGKNPP